GTSSWRARSSTSTAAAWPASPPTTCRSSPACACDRACARCPTSPAMRCRRPNSHDHGPATARTRVVPRAGGRGAAGAVVTRAARDHDAVGRAADGVRGARHLPAHGRAAAGHGERSRAGAGAGGRPHDGRRDRADGGAALGAPALQPDAQRSRARARPGARLVRGAGGLLAGAGPLLWRLRTLALVDLLLLGAGVVAVLALRRRPPEARATAEAALPPPWPLRAGLAALVRGGAVSALALLVLLAGNQWLAERP